MTDEMKAYQDVVAGTLGNMRKQIEALDDDGVNVVREPFGSTIGSIARHAIGSTKRFAGVALGVDVARPADLPARVSREELLAGIDEIVALLDGGLPGLTEGSLAQMRALGKGERSVRGVLFFGLRHLAHHAGQVSLYAAHPVQPTD